MTKIRVFLFEFAFCRIEGGYEVVSAHQTKRGAYQAMVRHKNQFWYEERAIFGKEVDLSVPMEGWRIREFRVEE